MTTAWMTKQGWTDLRLRADMARSALIERDEWTAEDEGTWEEMTPNTNAVTEYGVLDRAECLANDIDADEMLSRVAEWVRRERGEELQ